MDRQRIGNGLRRLRRMLDLEQKEVAGRLGMSQGAYSHWESGRTELRVSDLVRLSYALRVPLGTLMRFLDIPIEDRVLTAGQWEDSGRPEPTAASTPPPGGWRSRGPIPARESADTSIDPSTDTSRAAGDNEPPTPRRGAVPPGYTDARAPEPVLVGARRDGAA